MSEYRDDRQGLLNRIAELETELARAEKRAERHVGDALRVGEFENENRNLREQLREMEERRIPLVSLRPWIAAAFVTIFSLMIVIIVLLSRH